MVDLRTGDFDERDALTEGERIGFLNDCLRSDPGHKIGRSINFKKSRKWAAAPVYKMQIATYGVKTEESQQRGRLAAGHELCQILRHLWHLMSLTTVT